jgi:hypothetical protein
MDTTTRRPATALAMAGAVAAALTLVPAITPSVAGAQQPPPLPEPAARCAPSGRVAIPRAAEAGRVDVGAYIAHLKAASARYYVDHALELRQRVAR